jgi:hypothetical protein
MLVLFWISSSRGTDSKLIFNMPVKDLRDKAAVKDRLESWCSGFSAWDHGDNIVRYGHSTSKRKIEAAIREAKTRPWAVKVVKR